jgi:hypothetical protein
VSTAGYDPKRPPHSATLVVRFDAVIGRLRSFHGPAGRVAAAHAVNPEIKLTNITALPLLTVSTRRC